MTHLKIMWAVLGCLAVLAFFLPLVLNWLDRRWNTGSCLVMAVGAIVAFQAWLYVFAP